MTDKSLTRRYRLITAFFISLASIAPAFASDNSLTILLTNDDGYLSPGIRAMRQALLDQGHEVLMVAPAENQSGSSASISPDGITVTDHGLNVWSVDGRPADAVRFGLGQLMADQPPDLVISGINFGQNVGADVMISGTVGAATTAVRLGIPAIAISASIDFKEAGEAFPSTLKAMPKAAAFLAKQLRRSAARRQSNVDQRQLSFHRSSQRGINYLAVPNFHYWSWLYPSGEWGVAGELRISG